MAELRFSIIGKPTTKKTSNLVLCVEKGVRCTSCGLPRREKCMVCGRSKAGRHVVLPSTEYKRWEADSIPQLRVAFRRSHRVPITVPVSCSAVFYRERRVGDLVGYMQALGDTLQAAAVIHNDRQIVSWDGSRLAEDPEEPRVELTLVELFADDGLPALFEEVS